MTEFITILSTTTKELTITMREGKEMMSIKEEMPTLYIKAHKIVLENNYGINPYKKKAVPINESNIYYLEKKLFAKYGVANVGPTEKDLNDIILFPTNPADYHTGGLEITSRGVYVIKLDQKGGKLLFIRVLEILNGKIKVEYHLPE